MLNLISQFGDKSNFSIRVLIRSPLDPSTSNVNPESTKKRSREAQIGQDELPPPEAVKYPKDHASDKDCPSEIEDLFILEEKDEDDNDETLNVWPDTIDSLDDLENVIVQIKQQYVLFVA